jgi:hypothetical protein
MEKQLIGALKAKYRDLLCRHLLICRENKLRQKSSVAWQLLRTENRAIAQRMPVQLKADGEAGERRAAAVLSTALCAEVCHGSLREDYAKVDLKFTFRNVFYPTSLVTVHCQVKSGQSYFSFGENTRGGGVFCGSIDRGTIEALNKGSQPALYVWVPPPNISREVFWHLVKPRAFIKSMVKLPRSNYVRPSLRVDLSREHAYFNCKRGFRRLRLREINDDLKFVAKAAYAELKKEPITTPCCGLVYVTRRGWRRITRNSQPAQWREHSFRLIPYLRQILSQPPSRYVIVRTVVKKAGKFTHESREVV